MQLPRVVRSCGRLARPRTLLAAVPRLGVALVLASVLAVAPGEGLREPPRSGGVTDLVVPPGDVGDPPRGNLEGLPESSTARLAAYAEQVTSTGIPERALEAYVRAEAALERTDPDCGLSWSLLAAIGRVESDHGRYGGRSLLEDGTSSKPIIGLPLDGSPGLAEIRDTDGGRLDGDTEYDRAVGPMQFIPGTWERVASDGDDDGARNPHDIDDAALAAGRYLCAYGGLDTPEGLRAAILHYNPSAEYADLVMRIMALYEQGRSDSLPSPGVLPSTEPAPEPPLPHANVEPPPTQSGPRGGTDSPRPGGGSTNPGDDDPTSPRSGGGGDDGGSGGGGGGDDGVGGGGSSPSPTPTTTNEPTPDPSPSDSPSPTPSPTPCPSPSDTASPSPSPSPTPTDGTTADGCTPDGGTTTDPTASPTPTP